ncbi:Peptide chain release factor 1, mitochondrial [Marasmius crinis-equi]|uniref:Peptide chain release factor 1, mitochondrial n=1 Tax=Marasmius crinis-equi TaxID=585013 RepID=A0ABR3FK02_9AGAR
MLRVVESRMVERSKIQSQLTEDLASPDDIPRLRQLKDTESLQTAWDEWKTNKKLLEELAPFLRDTDETMRTLAEEDHQRISGSLTRLLSETFPSLLAPRSSTADLPGALLELKSGVGGTESSLFLATLLRMYERFATLNNWKLNTVSNNINEAGGIKDAIVEIKGEGAYDTLRWESGVHRVQRVPVTESGGRVHTSTVAAIVSYTGLFLGDMELRRLQVLPLLDEKDVQNEQLYTMDEIKLEVMRARGAGGQHVNKTESAVRLTHIPTGITVSMQDERSQHQNRRRAFQVLSARLMDQKITREIAERRATRNSLVKSADRSEKIRTYNYAQERVTDHRIGLSIMNLSSVLEGDALRDITDALNQDYAQKVMEDMLTEDGA